jgi:GNAT superfamily N-acetyltransferase
MPENQPFYLHHFWFTGRIKDKKELRDLVYQLGGAPVDSPAVFTQYIVVGEGGEKTKGYQKVADGIERGRNIALTSEELRDICNRQRELPLPHLPENTDVIVLTTERSEAWSRQLKIDIWQNKRDLFVERYGAPTGDGSRVTMEIRKLKAIKRVLDVQIVSVRDKPEYLERAVNYLANIWNIPQVVYQDCVEHSIKTDSALPRWYLLESGVGDIIGSFGLITNDFISRQDLHPWLCALHINESFRGHKFGARLLEYGKSEAAKLGFKKLYLCTDHIGYYEKYGWRYKCDGYSISGEPCRIYEIDTSI